jgi:integrase
VETGELNVSKSLEQTKAGGLRVKGTKSEEPRRFVIPDRAISVLAEHRTEQENDKRLFGSDYEDHGLIFCQPGGAYYSPDGVGARVVELMRRRTGACQPAFLTALPRERTSQQGVPLPVVSERLGHADQNITLSIYSHARPADTRATAKAWNDAMADVIQDSRKAGAERKLADLARRARKRGDLLQPK